MSRRQVPTIVFGKRIPAILDDTAQTVTIITNSLFDRPCVGDWGRVASLVIPVPEISGSSWADTWPKISKGFTARVLRAISSLPENELNNLKDIILSDADLVSEIPDQLLTALYPPVSKTSSSGWVNTLVGYCTLSEDLCNTLRGQLTAFDRNTHITRLSVGHLGKTDFYSQLDDGWVCQRILFADISSEPNVGLLGELYVLQLVQESTNNSKAVLKYNYSDEKQSPEAEEFFDLLLVDGWKPDVNNQFPTAPGVPRGQTLIKIVDDAPLPKTGSLTHTSSKRDTAIKDMIRKAYTIVETHLNSLGLNLIIKESERTFDWFSRWYISVPCEENPSNWLDNNGSTLVGDLFISLDSPLLNGTDINTLWDIEISVLSPSWGGIERESAFTGEIWKAREPHMDRFADDLVLAGWRPGSSKTVRNERDVQLQLAPPPGVKSEILALPIPDGFFP